MSGKPNDQVAQKEAREHEASEAYGLRRLREGTGWQQKFDKTHDHVDVYVPATGQLIRWEDRGNGQAGVKHTWSWQDPVGETRSIRHWVGDGDQIRLKACITVDGGTGDRQIDMDTLYDGVRKQRWEFDGKPEEHDIKR